MKKSNNKFISNTPLLITVIVLIGLGFSLGSLINVPQKELEYKHIVDDNIRLDSLYKAEVAINDSLKIKINTLTSLREEGLVIIEGLKNKRDEEISSIDTMSHSSLYEFFSGR